MLGKDATRILILNDFFSKLTLNIPPPRKEEEEEEDATTFHVHKQLGLGCGSGNTPCILDAGEY